VPQGVSPTRVDEVCRPLHALLRLLGTPSEPLLQLWEDHESVRAAAVAAAATGTSGGAVASGATPRAQHGARAPAFREVEALGAPLAQHGAWPVIGTWDVAGARRCERAVVSMWDVAEARRSERAVVSTLDVVEARRSDRAVVSTLDVAEARGDVLTTARGDVWTLPQIVQVG